MAGRKRERYEIEPRISVPFMLELEYESKIIKRLLVIKEICFWLPPGLDGRKVCKFLQNFMLCHQTVYSSGQISLAQYLMNGLSNLCEAYREYSLAPTGPSPTDDLVRFWRERSRSQRAVKVANVSMYP